MPEFISNPWPEWLLTLLKRNRLWVNKRIEIPAIFPNILKTFGPPHKTDSRSHRPHSALNTFGEEEGERWKGEEAEEHDKKLNLGSVELKDGEYCSRLTVSVLRDYTLYCSIWSTRTGWCAKTRKEEEGERSGKVIFAVATVGGYQI